MVRWTGDAPRSMRSWINTGFRKDRDETPSTTAGSRRKSRRNMYVKGGHDFGMRKQNLPTDQWIERFGEWLAVRV